MTKKRSSQEIAVGRHRKNGAVLPGPWKPHLDMYTELRALQFSSREDFAAAGRLLWNELRDLPYDLTGNHTIIIPREAVRYFKGLAFHETEVLSPADLPAAELAELRREQGPY
jgi:hypothetical protein